MVVPTLKELWDDFRAWRRGEKRVVPYGVHGRVYERKIKDESIAGLLATGKFAAKIIPTGYYNAVTKLWYDIDENGNRTQRKVKD